MLNLTSKHMSFKFFSGCVCLQLSNIHPFTHSYKIFVDSFMLQCFSNSVSEYVQLSRYTRRAVCASIFKKLRGKKWELCR